MLADGLMHRSKKHRCSALSDAGLIYLDIRVGDYFAPTRFFALDLMVEFLGREPPAIYVVDAKFFESTAGDADRCLETPSGVVRDRARVKSPEPVMRRLPRRKVK